MIFLDVGAHEGQTLEEVVKPRWGFDRIFAFEPMPEQFAVLSERYGTHERVTLLPYGLAEKTGSRQVYGLNHGMEASIYPAKRDLDPNIVTVCSMVQASMFIADEIADDDRLIVKLNCEGAEVPILDDLIDTGAIEMIENVLIDFDIRKVDGQEKEADRILARLHEIGFTRYRLADDVMIGPTHQARIAAWLETVL